MTTFTYDPSTDLGRVRLLISDTDDTDVSRQLYQDNAIDAFLAMATGTGTPMVKRAAALALESIAGNLAQVLKVIRTQDLQTDGAKTADSLRAVAKQLRDGAMEDEDEDPDSGGLHVLDYDPYLHLRGRFL